MKKWHLWLAASIGLVVIAGMMIREFDVEALGKIELSPRFFLGVGLAVLLFVVQNLMLTLRFRHLCQRKLSVAAAFRKRALRIYFCRHSFGGGRKRFGFYLSEPRRSFYGQKYFHHVCSPACR